MAPKLTVVPTQAPEFRAEEIADIVYRFSLSMALRANRNLRVAYIRLAAAQIELAGGNSDAIDQISDIAVRGYGIPAEVVERMLAAGVRDAARQASEGGRL
jgi:hypothetical protein